MSKGFAILAGLLSGLATLMVHTSAHAVVKAYLYPLTGEVRLANEGATAFSLVYYDIFYGNSLPAGGLNPANGVWLSVADVYDASGNGFIDPVNQWTELPSTLRQLAEGLFNGVGTSHLPAVRSIGLGKIWKPNIVLPSQLTMRVAAEGQPSVVPIAITTTIDGNYDGNRTVDTVDYTQWRNVFGMTTTPFADGNHNGIVEAADYTVWRDHLGQTLIGTPFGTGHGAASGLMLDGAVPELASRQLLLLATAGLCLLRHRAATTSQQLGTP